MFKWIAHVVREWDLGSGPMASLVKCLKVLKLVGNGYDKSST
jgi:hypothetical protein